MQVPTRLGWVFVNPYMTLVLAYERLIGARGTEIKAGDAVPAFAGIPPLIRSSGPATTAQDPAIIRTEQSAAVRVKPHKATEKPQKKRRHVGKRSRRNSG
jgi:hypothetical protein